MSSFSVSSVQSFVKAVFPSLRKTQQINLALGVFGLIGSGSGIISKIVRKIPKGSKKHKHRFKRMWRFLSNDRVKPEKLAAFWIRWCLRTFSPRYEKDVPVAIDWTTLPGNIQCLMMAVPFHGRAIPLLWRMVRYRDFADSQNRIEEGLVDRLINLFPSDKMTILIADRGFGRASFIQFLLKKNLRFVIRVRGDVWIRTKEERSTPPILLRHLTPKLEANPNTPLWFKNIAYREDEIIGIGSGVNLAAIVAEGSDDPWFLATNLGKAETAIPRYTSRFQIEEWFKDLKHELGIDDLQTKNLKRVRRILFIACIAYGLMMLVGTLADRFSTWRDNLITGGKEVCSRIWFALRLIEYNLAPSFFWRRVWAKAKGRSP